MAESIAKVMEVRSVNESIRPGVAMIRPEMEVLFVGPFVLQTVLQQRAEYWKGKFEMAYDVEMNVHVADPPFEVDDTEC